MSKQTPKKRPQPQKRQTATPKKPPTPSALDNRLDTRKDAIRLNKLMASYGLCSRRQADEWIQAGRVSVDGVVCRELGVSVHPDRQRVIVDGKPLLQRPTLYYIALNKPVGVVTTRHDPQGRTTVIDLLPPHLREAGLFPVGRLDADSEGLLILTNDGDWAQTLLHPRHEVWKEYLVELDRSPQDDELKRLAAGILIGGKKTLPAQVRFSGSAGNAKRLSISIREGRNRQIRKMCGAVGLKVRRLRRVGIGSLRLEGIGAGQWRPLREDEIAALG